MKKLALQLAIGLFIISTGAFAQQWNGSLDINNSIYRNGAIGIGSNLYNGDITFGAMGTHLSIGRADYPNQIILATGWLQGVGDYTELHVPGQEANNVALLRMFHNGNVGIGTTQPHEKLQIGPRFLFHDGGSKKICYNSYYDPNVGGIRRVEDAPVGEMVFTADGTIQFGVAPTGAANSVVDNYTTAMVIANNGNVGFGTSNPGSFKLAVEGKIAAREIQVTLQNPFPDYVFDSKYKLRNLSSLENYINENKHLPNVPSAAEVEKNGGIELGQMNTKLLEKVEELTLYIIEINKKVEKLEKENEALKKR